MALPPCSLELIIKNAKDLPNVNPLGPIKAAAFVKTDNKLVCITEADTKGGTSPTWNEMFCFHSNDGFINIAILHVPSGDELRMPILIGSATISLPDLVKSVGCGKCISLSLTLESPKVAEGPRGVLEVDVNVLRLTGGFNRRPFVANGPAPAPTLALDPAPAGGDRPTINWSNQWQPAEGASYWDRPDREYGPPINRPYQWQQAGGSSYYDWPAHGPPNNGPNQWPPAEGPSYCNWRPASHMYGNGQAGVYAPPNHGGYASPSYRPAGGYGSRIESALGAARVVLGGLGLAQAIAYNDQFDNSGGF